jgi:hypothetical protein
MVTNPAENAMKDVIEMYHISLDLVMKKMDMYNKCRELDEEDES